MKYKHHLCTENPDDLILVPRWYVESMAMMIASVPEWYNSECLDGIHDE